MKNYIFSLILCLIGLFVFASTSNAAALDGARSCFSGHAVSLDEDNVNFAPADDNRHVYKRIKPVYKRDRNGKYKRVQSHIFQRSAGKFKPYKSSRVRQYARAAKKWCRQNCISR